MSQHPSESPFQDLPAEAAPDEAETPPLRRLQTPAERFRAGEVARDLPGETSPFDAELEAGESDDAELEPSSQQQGEPPIEAAPNPFAPAPRSREVAGRRAVRGKRGAQVRRARRRLKQHAPHYHEKKLGAGAHKPIKAASEPQSDWDRAAQNSMARAALARKKARVRRVIGRVVLASGVLLSVWAGGTALTAPQFNVGRVEIDGVAQTSPAKVKQLAAKLIGQNVFLASRGQVATQVEALPTVASARVARAWSWPPHMKLVVTERQPILQVGAGTTWWVVDEAGIAFRRADRQDDHLDKLTAPQLKPVTGKALPAAPWRRARQLHAALATDNALAMGGDEGQNGEFGGSKQNKFWDLRRIYLDENSAAALRISGKGDLKQHDELLVRLGEEEWATKLKQARVALAYFEKTGRHASELDLVSSEHPRWKPKEVEPVKLAQTTTESTE